MNVSFHPDAEAELGVAVDYYESCEPGLGIAFYNELEATILHILDFPHAWPLLTDDIHRCLINRFPLGVLYAIENDHILILAVMHLQREPGYWLNRQ